MNDKLVPVRGDVAAFHIRLQHRGVVHAFAGHIGKHDRILAAGMTGPGDMFCGLAGQQQAIAATAFTDFTSGPSIQIVAFNCPGLLAEIRSTIA